MMRVAYVSSSFGQNLNRFGVSAEGQALISSNMSGMRAVQGLRQFSIASDSLVDIKPGDVGRGIGFSLSQGALLGYGPDGRPVTAPHDLQVLQVTAFENDPSKGNFVRVMASHDITEFPQSQVIGGTKGMAPEVSQGYIDKVMRGIGAADLQGVSAVITMDDLKKERHLHYEQMFTSLWEYTQANMQGGKQFSGLNMPVGSDFHSWAEKARAFEADPSREIAAIHKAATQADKFDHDLVLRELVQRARGADLTATQFGHVFGAVPEVFDMGTNAGTWYERTGQFFTPAEMAAVGRGVVSGHTQFFLSSLGSKGGLGSIEPRAFELLNSPNLGVLGTEIQAEIAGRMMTAYPGKLLERDALTESLKSMVHPGSRQGAMSASAILGSLGEGEIIPAGSTDLRITGVGDIHIPGTGILGQLSPLKSAAGTMVHPDLAHAYRDVLDTAAKHDARNVTDDVMRRSLAKLQGHVAQARMLSVTGNQGLARGKLPGSRSLTALLPTEGMLIGS
jgi:hypothetical protein